MRKTSLTERRVSGKGRRVAQPGAMQDGKCPHLADGMRRGVPKQSQVPILLCLLTLTRSLSLTGSFLTRLAADDFGGCQLALLESSSSSHASLPCLSRRQRRANKVLTPPSRPVCNQRRKTCVWIALPAMRPVRTPRRTTTRRYDSTNLNAAFPFPPHPFTDT
jgi:hypothetical protein